MADPNLTPDLRILAHRLVMELAIGSRPQQSPTSLERYSSPKSSKSSATFG
jgi:hypothetical protein